MKKSFILISALGSQFFLAQTKPSDTAATKNIEK